MLHPPDARYSSIESASREWERRPILPTTTESHRTTGAVTFAPPSNAKPKGGIGQTYEWFLELPVWLVIAVMWFAGAAIIGLGGLPLYLLAWLLWRVAGA